MSLEREISASIDHSGCSLCGHNVIDSIYTINDSFKRLECYTKVWIVKTVP